MKQANSRPSWHSAAGLLVYTGALREGGAQKFRSREMQTKMGRIRLGIAMLALGTLMGCLGVDGYQAGGDSRSAPAMRWDQMDQGALWTQETCAVLDRTYLGALLSRKHLEPSSSRGRRLVVWSRTDRTRHSAWLSLRSGLGRGAERWRCQFALRRQDYGSYRHARRCREPGYARCSCGLGPLSFSAQT